MVIVERESRSGDAIPGRRPPLRVRYRRRDLPASVVQRLNDTHLTSSMRQYSAGNKSWLTPQLNALMAATRNHEIDCVLVWKFDRNSGTCDVHRPQHSRDSEQNSRSNQSRNCRGDHQTHPRRPADTTVTFYTYPELTPNPVDTAGTDEGNRRAGHIRQYKLAGAASEVNNS
jgi:hypothetical protein